MSKQQNKRNVPDIRFPEFEDEWEEKRLKDVLILTPRPLKMGDDDQYSLVTVKRRYCGVVIRGKYFGRDIKVKSQFILKVNDFLISKRQISHKAFGLVPKELDGSIVSNEYSVFIPQNNLDIYYFNHFCRRPSVSYTFFLSSIGVHIEKMLFHVDDWLKRKFYFPVFTEQQKIASFLSDVDTKIEKLIHRKELLEQYKKGVMQKLFSSEIRFKDENGEDYPEWEKKKLSNIGVFTSGIGFSEKEQGGEQGIPFYKVSDMKLNANKFVMNKANNYVSDEQIIKLKYKPIIEESLIFAKVGAAIFLERKRVAANFLLDNNMMAFTPAENIIFFKYLFDRIRLSQYAQVGALPSYNSSDLKIIEVHLPHQDEQNRISGFLADIDSKINRIAKEISTVKEFKKGLLQGMFV